MASTMVVPAAEGPSQGLGEDAWDDCIEGRQVIRNAGTVESAKELTGIRELTRRIAAARKNAQGGTPLG